MNVVEIRGRKGTNFDFAHVTPTTSGLNAIATAPLDSSGNAPGDTGYTGQGVTLLTALDSDTDSITSHDIVGQPNGGSSARIVTTTPGTKVQASAATSSTGVFFQALRTNTDVVTVGFSDVVGTPIGSRKGIKSLPAGGTLYVPVTNPSTLYIDSMVAPEGCMVTVLTRS